MIPDEAVVAAARAMVGEREWPDHSETWRKDYLEDMRAALEAAAPHLIAEASDDALRAAWDRGYATGQDGLSGRIVEAWDEGYDRAETDYYGTGFWAKRLRANPYRKPTDAN